MKITNYKYNSVEGTINDGVSNTSISLGNIRVVYQIEIINDSKTLNDDFTVKFNSTSSASITIKADESFTISDMELTALYMSNSSGSNIDYRVRLLGI